MNDDLITTTYRAVDVEALQSRYALRVTARLAEHSEALPHDVCERLRFARGRALDQARARRATATSPQQPVGIGSAGVLALGGGERSPSPWWSRAAQLLPLLALVAGLVLIQNQNVRAQIAAAAEIDFDLLVDELPPTAYSDPGFLEFLKAPRD